MKAPLAAALVAGLLLPMLAACGAVDVTVTTSDDATPAPQPAQAAPAATPPEAPATDGASSGDSSAASDGQGADSTASNSNTPGAPAQPQEPPSVVCREGQTGCALSFVNEAALRVAESWPPQYFVDIYTDQPSPCAQLQEPVFTVDGADITVTVWNYTEPGMACAAVIVPGHVVLALGSAADYEPDTQYTVNINDSAAVVTFKTDPAAQR